MAEHVPAGMVPYDHPVYHNGKRVLWHGSSHGAVRGKAAKSDEGDDAPAAEKPKAARATEAPPARDIGILADSDDACATHMAGDLVSAMKSGGVSAHVVAGHAATVALAKAIASDGADLAIAPLDSLNANAKATLPWREKAPYLMRLANERVEVIAPKSVTDLNQLNGKTVAIGPVDSAGGAVAAALFQRLNVRPIFIGEATNIGFSDIGAGKVDAIVVVGGGDPKAMADLGKDGKLHVLRIGWTPALRGLYAPARLTAQDRPNLIAADEKVDTVAAPMALVALDAAPDTPRARRASEVASALFEKFATLQADGAETGWRDVNLAAVADWPRLKGAQDWVEQHKRAADASLEAFRASAHAVAATNGGPAAADADTLYRSLIQWRTSTP